MKDGPHILYLQIPSLSTPPFLLPECPSVCVNQPFCLSEMRAYNFCHFPKDHSPGLFLPSSPGLLIFLFLCPLSRAQFHTLSPLPVCLSSVPLTHTTSLSLASFKGRCWQLLADGQQRSHPGRKCSVATSLLKISRTTHLHTSAMWGLWGAAASDGWSHSQLYHRQRTEVSFQIRPTKNVQLQIWGVGQIICVKHQQWDVKKEVSELLSICIAEYIVWSLDWMALWNHSGLRGEENSYFPCPHWSYSQILNVIARVRRQNFIY